MARSRINSARLFDAVRQSNVRTLKALLSEPGALQVRDEEGDTLLHCAASVRSLPCLELLLSQGAEVHAENGDDETALERALSSAPGPTDKQALGIVDALLTAGAKVERNKTLSTPLIDAARGGLVQVVRRLLAAGAKLEKKDANDWTPLLAAISNRHWEIAEVLLEAGASLTTRSRFGPALTLAEGRGGAQAVARLTKVRPLRRTVSAAKKPAPARRAPSVEQQLMRAVQRDDLIAVETAIAAGAQVDVVTGAAGRPLNRAAAAGSLGIVKRLVEHGAAVAGWERDRTALHSAAESGQLTCVKWLLAHGSEADACGASGTALHLAARGGHLAVVRALLAARSNPSLVDDDEGLTPLHEAARAGHAAIAALLLSKGAARTTLTRGGQHPFELVDARRHPELRAKLQRA